MTAKEVTEAVQSAMLEADLSGHHGELWLEWFDHVPNKLLQHISQTNATAAGRMENKSVGLPRHADEQFAQLGVNRNRARPFSFSGPRGTSLTLTTA